MKVFVYSVHGFDQPFLEKANQGLHQLFFSDKTLNESTVHLSEGCEAISLFSSDTASEPVIKQLQKMGIRYIALRSVGYDHVDMVAARACGIRVANVPAYSPNAIAEHAVALLLALNRKVILAQQLMQKNDFRLDKLVGFDLYGKTVGIIGTGNIGSAFARIMNGFGCRLLAYDPVINAELLNEIPLIYTTFEEVCMQSDVISVCCPLNPSTRYLFNKDTFSMTKKGMLFINTARGGIVNTIDLLNALDSGLVSAAGLDVYEYEKPIFFYDHTGKNLEDKLFERLRNHSNVLLTGHQAFLTQEALSGISTTTINNLNQWESLRESVNEIN